MKNFGKFYEKWQTKQDLEAIWNRKIFYVKILMLSLFFLLLLRLFYLQVIKHEHYLKKAKARSVATYVIKAPRGEIITADGVVVATNRAIFQLYLDLESLTDEEAILKKLSLILGEDFGALKERYYLAKRTQIGRVLLKRNLSWDEVSKIMVRRYYLPGVIVEVEAERYYPYGEAYFHLLGYVARISKEEYNAFKDQGYSPEDYIGKVGVERLYEKYLKGKNGKIEIERDAYGRLGKVVGREDPVAGEDIILTVRHDLQMKAYELLKDKRGAIVALSPRDGALISLVSAPSIDPNKFITGFEEGEWKRIVNDPRKPLLNKALQPYPPGSTFKVFTAFAGLKAGIIKGLNWSVWCSGAFSYGNHIFRCWERRGHGSVNLTKAIALSCDVYFYTVGSRIDIDVLAEVAQDFGLGKPSGIGLPNEKEGLIPTKAWKKKRFNTPWQQGETVVVAIGQGYLLTTPIQLARSYMAIANGGFLYKVYVAKEIRSKTGKILMQASPEVERKIEIEPTHLEWIREGLKEAVETGTGRAARVPGIDVRGKTGTAQVVALKRKTPLTEHHAWFVSYAGNGTPEIVSAILVEHGGGGGAVAAPLAGELYRAYYHLPSLLKPKIPSTEAFPEESPPEVNYGNFSPN